jgi:hypothetical protein
VSYPYNQGRKHPSMEVEYGGRVHSGGLPTPIVHKYSSYLIEVRSQSKNYKVQGGGVPSRVIREKVKGQPSSAGPIWGVVGVLWSLMTVVALATTI